MRNYDWREFPNRPLSARFPDWVIGRHLLFEVNEDDPEAMRQRLEQLVEYRRLANWGTPPLECPRVFISHRQADEARAREIAAIAQKIGFQWWLDVLDPTLATITNLTVSETFRLALLIEEALLNSTHVLALMTTNTRGSMWIPYEYGRVKDSSPYSLQGAYWIDSALDQQIQHTGPPLPEYLLLGVRTESDREIERWLLGELRSWQKQYAACATGDIIMRSGPDPHQVEGNQTLSEATLEAIAAEVHAGLKRPLPINPPIKLRTKPDR